MIHKTSDKGPPGTNNLCFLALISNSPDQTNTLPYPEQIEN